MGQKRTPKLVSLAKKLRAEGKTFGEVAEALTKEAKKPISKASVVAWLKDQAPAAPPPPAAPPKVERVPVGSPPTSSPDEGEEETEVRPGELRRVLSALLREAKAAADEARAAGNATEAKSQTKVAAVLAGQLRQIHKQDEDDGSVIRLKAGDVQAAAERTARGLQQLAERVEAERSTWPRCTACGQPCGTFPAGDKSPIRGLVERIFGRSP